MTEYHDCNVLTQKLPMSPLKVRLETISIGGRAYRSYGIIDGDNRYLAAQTLGLTELTVIVLDLTDSQAMIESYRSNQTKSYSLAERVSLCSCLAELGLSITAIVNATGLTTAANFIKLNRGLRAKALEYYLTERMSQAAALTLVDLPRQSHDYLINTVLVSNGKIDNPTLLKVIGKTGLNLVRNLACGQATAVAVTKAKPGCKSKTAVTGLSSVQDSLRLPAVLPAVLPALLPVPMVAPAVAQSMAVTTKPAAFNLEFTLAAHRNVTAKLSCLQQSDGSQTYQLSLNFPD